MGMQISVLDVEAREVSLAQTYGSADGTCMSEAREQQTVFTRGKSTKASELAKPSQRSLIGGCALVSRG